MTDKAVLLTTCSSADEAERLARHLLEARLAACVTVIPQIRSYYRWQGKIEASEEFLLVVKTAERLLPELQKALDGLHSYELPELLALRVDAGSQKYLDWMEGELKRD